FPGVHALRECRFDLRAGEVHALVGENGAGKSTLMKVLAGVYRRDAGRIRVKGAEVDIPTPRAAQLLGISIIHQELSLMPNLTAAEVDELFRIIRQLRDDGVGVVHISHRLEELKRISDRVTVMRDGQYIATVDTKAAAIAEIIRMMVGRTIYEEAPEIPEVADPNVVLDVRDLARGRAVRGVSFTVRRGEILGFAGLVGAGRTEVARAVFGADRPDSAQIRVHGRPTRINGPGDAVRQGIGHLSEDRKRYGLALGMDVETNIVLATLRKFLRAFGRVDARRTRATAQQLVQRLAIKTPSLRQKVRNLSGGTQQKVVVAKWLSANTDILIFDEPTRGIDVGAK